MSASHLNSLKVKNFRSFYDQQTVTFDTDESNRTVTAIYGPNASGKSNIAHALKFVKWLITNSNQASVSEIPRDPFHLKKDSADKPSDFEIDFKHHKRHFIYGLSVQGQSVQHEYLKEFASATVKKPRVIFDRKGDQLNPSAEKYSFGKKLFESTRATSLLITKARENNNEYANIVFEWLNNISILDGAVNETINWSMQELRKNPDLYEPMLALLNQGDFWIRSFAVEDINIPKDLIDQLPFKADLRKHISSSSHTTVKTTHAVRDKNQKIVGEHAFDLSSSESSGTQKFFALAGPIIDTLENGRILFIDEFGSHLHPDMCRFIVSLFKSSANKKCAQLIINTHDTSLMSKDGILEREDILFIEKNFSEESIVSTLTSKAVRADESFEYRYRQGLYGAKPQIKQIED